MFASLFETDFDISQHPCEEVIETESSSNTVFKITEKLMNVFVFGSKKILSKKQRDESSAFHTRMSAFELTSLCKANTTTINPTPLCASSVIGRGGYGKVMLVYSPEDEIFYAVKEIAKENLKDSPDHFKLSRSTTTKVQYVEQECAILRFASEHPFITSFYGSYQTEFKAYVCMEYCAGSDLYQHMQRSYFSENRARLYVAEIALALGHLHENNIIFRDLKPENVLLDSNGHIRLADFGLAVAFSKSLDCSDMRCFSICGTPEYIAPEMVLMAMKKNWDSKLSYGKTVDWWALGVLTFEMLFKVCPFYHSNSKEHMNNILKCDVKLPLNPKIKPPSDDAQSFILSLLKVHETERLGYGKRGSQDILDHPFLNCLDKDAVLAMEYTPDFVPELKYPGDVFYFDKLFTNEVVRDDTVESVKELKLVGFDEIDNSIVDLWYNNH